MKNKCKNSRNKPEEQKKWKAAEKFQQTKPWKRWRLRGREESRREEKIVEILSPLLSSNWFI